jgi:hypothetical protein
MIPQRLGMQPIETGAAELASPLSFFHSFDA